ncbi:restriction endonuclease subunit S [Mariniradius sediminis]|uniref:Restriction endonuclease subunit S n=1 Tax=Mariniradius sediminis TaxID=2909237 RepID=A0ABS9BZT5_9BACT|nr:restriction endonuclease subunit S [Mariniradius sediminis]MCF1753180.1 restriction endonuclease subunit S [Mariniradius sediminis]
MSKEDKLALSRVEGLIPELRFPEFKNEGEWEINEFGELINILADYTANGSFASLKENVTYYNSDEYAVLVRTTDLDKKTFTPARFTDKRGYDFLSKTSLYGNEIVMANVGSIGKVFRVPYFNKPMTLAPNTYVLKFYDFVDEGFIYQLMVRPEFEKKLLSMVGSSTLMAINKGNLRSIKVAVPKRKEQQKIASCLSSLDEVITVQSQKLELLKDHKKGLMQNLFPQDGEKVPKFRFKEFEKEGEWRQKELSELGFLINGLTYSPEDVRDQGLLVLRSSNIQNGLIDLIDCVYVREDINGANLTQPKDILICVRNGSKNLIGKNAIIPQGIPFATHGAFMTVFRAKNPKFVFQLFQTDYYDKQVKADLGATINSINGKNFIKYKFPVPENPKEQQKIASCLSSLDALITAQAGKIEHLKLHKRGLMQGIFPKIND